MCKSIVSQIRQKTYTTMDDMRHAAGAILQVYESIGSVPIVRIVKDAGFKVFSNELPDNIGGAIYLNSELEPEYGSSRIIVVNSKETPYRKRFSIAHEFGHYLLDPKARNTGDYFNALEDDDNKDELETRIDRFAAELLIPFEKFRQQYDALKNRYEDSFDLIMALSKFFEVPSAAVERRFQEVGIEL